MEIAQRGVLGGEELGHEYTSKVARIYTKTGDRGETGLIGGGRVSKSSARIAAIGDVDELNAAIGVVRAAEDAAILRQIQEHLFELGASLAGSPHAFARAGQAAAMLEAEIDRAEAELQPLKNFILPGGCALAAGLQFARAVCRRAERTLATLAAVETVRPEEIVYLNRLSDYLFTAARLANAKAGVNEVQWRPETQ